MIDTGPTPSAVTHAVSIVGHRFRDSRCPEAGRRCALAGLLGGLGMVALAGCGLGSGAREAELPAARGTLLPLARIGSEPPGFATYTYVLFAYQWNEETQTSDTAISSVLAARYGDMLAALDAMLRPRARGASGSGPLVCVPSRHTAGVDTLEEYGAAVSLACLALVEDAFRHAGQAMPLRRWPGPHLVTTTRSLSDLRADTRLLAIDLTDADPGSFRPLLLALDETLRAPAATGPSVLEALRDRLAGLAAAGRFRLGYIAGVTAR